MISFEILNILFKLGIPCGFINLDIIIVQFGFKKNKLSDINQKFPRVVIDFLN